MTGSGSTSTPPSTSGVGTCSRDSTLTGCVGSSDEKSKKIVNIDSLVEECFLWEA